MLSDKEQYDFHEMVSTGDSIIGGGTVEPMIQYQVGYGLNKHMEKDSEMFKDAYIPFGLVTHSSKMEGGDTYTSAVRTHAMNTHCQPLSDELFDQLFENVTKPVVRKTKRHTYRKSTKE